jgi:hypothetical protein
LHFGGARRDHARLWEEHARKYAESHGLLPLVPQRENLQRAALEPQQPGFPLNADLPAPRNPGVTGGDPDPLRGDRDHTVGKGLAAGGLMRAEAVGKYSERFANVKQRRAMAAVGLTAARLKKIIDSATEDQLQQLV